MSRENIEDIYSLSPMQQGMLFHSLHSPETGMYNEQVSCRLRGKLNVAAFERAWQTAVDRHPILRTAFIWEDLDEPVQVVYKRVELPFKTLDWRAFDPEERKQRFSQLLQAELENRFDLSQAPLMRFTLVQEAEDSYRLVWNHHHLLIDGWSMPLLLDEVFAYYEAYCNGATLQRPLPRPFRDYIAWLQEQDRNQAERYWREQLKDFLSPTPIGHNRRLPESAQPKDDYGREKRMLPSAESDALTEFSRRHQVTTSTLVQAAWALLLSQYSREEDVVFGATVSGRPTNLPGSEQMLGLFINTLPVRVRLEANQPLLDWLKSLQLQLSEMRQYEYCSLTEIQGWSEVPRNLPLFHSILVFENYPVNEALDQKSRSLSIEEFEFFSRTNYPLTVVASPGKQLGLEMAYDKTRFDPEMIARMLEQMRQVLNNFLINPERPLSQLDFLTEVERHQMLVEWNQTKIDFPSDRCIHELFEAQVAATPNGIALMFEEQQLSYRELNQRANQLAHYLRKYNVEPEVKVGICLERSIEMIVAILGVLKAGGAYVPMDSSYPRERLGYILDDSGGSILISSSQLSDILPETSAKIIYIDTDWNEITQERDENLDIWVSPDNLAYVIYTSGSTGKPKGTLLTHRGLCNFVTVFNADLNIGSQSRMLQFSSIGFDASVAEIFPALVAGATVVLARQITLLSVSDLHQLLQESGVTVATLPPSLLAVLDPDGLEAFQDVMSVGEACTPEIVHRWARGRNFWNGYGPTEATIGASWTIVNDVSDHATSVPIGKAIGNKQIYLLDKYLRPVPLGVAGEIHIGGIGLARGYLNRPDLTAEKFIPDPFSGESGARLYKTGDLAQYRPDGTLEFIGRVDHQVKIRGFRIELGEIESVLHSHAAIQMATVIATDDPLGKKRLVAYFTTKPEVERIPSVTDLHQFLKTKLPDYMVPAVFVRLESFPLTSSGKIDRRRLPSPDEAQFAVDRVAVAPRTATEELLAGIFTQVLGIDRVSIHDNFFELGGHSLLATQLLSRIREMFQVPLQLREIFEAPTILALGRKIDDYRLIAKGIPLVPITPVPRTDDLPLSFAQQRLWFLDQLAPNSAFYNIPTALRLTGLLDEAALVTSLETVIQRHEVLRTTFPEHDGKPYQKILDHLPLPLEKTDLSRLDDTEREAEIKRLAEQEAQKPFNLSQGPLLRIHLIKAADHDHVLLFTMHHIISDVWSVGLLIREVAALYQGFVTKRPVSLPELPLQYADFAHWQRNWLQGPVLDAQLDYWRQQLSGAPPLLELPTDRPRPAVQTFHGRTIQYSLPKQMVEAFKEISQQEQVTLFMTLLAAFQTLLARYSGQNDISVGTPIANRNRVETENIVGFFVNTLVLRTIIDPDMTFRNLLAKVREVALGAYAHQDVPFEMLVDALHPQRDLSHTPLFQVMFVFQNAPAQSLELTDLTITSVQAESGVAKFDLSIILSEHPEGLAVGFEYNTDLFDESTIERMFKNFEVMLQGIIDDPDQVVWRLPILTLEEQRQTLVDWNQTEQEFPKDRCVHELFAELARDNPDAIAAIYQGQVLTYGELNRRANQLGRHLQTLGVGPDVPVGICMERSLEMVVGIMAALKAGGAFLPLDPVYPPERLAYMMEDSRIPVVLTQQELLPGLPQHHAKAIALDSEWPTISASYSDEDLPIQTTPDNLAYVIYTSGSTGKPKGTMLGHRGLCNLAKAQQQAFDIELGTKILQFSSLSFDAAVWETVMALLNLGTLCLAPRNLLASGDGLVSIMADQKVNVVTLPPSVAAVMPEHPLPELRVMITAGEKCTAEIVSKWGAGRKFFNAYGPTETTVCASMLLVTQHYRQGPPIGRPINNFQLYILDSYWQPVPIGVAGELCVAGVGLARGYLGRPELTADKFIPNPFSSIPGARLYRTGDLVRYLPDGNVEFLGRIDHQVKVRGFRIELGEIEAVLGEHPDVRDVIVIAREDIPGDRRLVAYLVTRPDVELKTTELRNYLRNRLPEYMVPSHFVKLDEFPLTPNNKIDRNALPKPDTSRPDLDSEYVAPRNETEQKLAAICAELLNIERVGIYDSFFDLGGHSLLATQFLSRLRSTFQVELPLRIVFEKPRIVDLAQEIELQKAMAQDQSQTPTIQRVSREAYRMNLSEITAQ